VGPDAGGLAATVMSHTPVPHTCASPVCPAPGAGSPPPTCSSPASPAVSPLTTRLSTSGSGGRRQRTAKQQARMEALWKRASEVYRREVHPTRADPACPCDDCRRYRDEAC
jgi:hypothetical protein